jgi:O-antigen/teichoic acid export membrane protein
VTNGRVLARNSALNLFGLAVPIFVAILAIPPLVRGLGVERFGVLTLAWAAIGYFSLFELGLSRALTQAVAQRLGNGGEHELPAITWTALGLLFGLGILGGGSLALLTPSLVNDVLNIPEGLRDETIVSFWILSASLPLVVTTVGMRGLMEAHQHFGVATVLRVPLASFTFLGPLLLLPFSRSLIPAVSILAAGRAIGFVAHLYACLQLYPFLKRSVTLRREPTVAMLRFGGWTTVSNVVSPMMVFLDRFVIGAMLSLAAVAHYVTPYEIVIKLLMIPIALLGVMFPAFAATVTRDPERMGELYAKSFRAVMIVTFPIALVAVVLAREGLLLWVGPVLPEESARVLQLLAIGVFISGIAQPPFAALQGAGRPDLIAKLHVLELPFYIAGMFTLIRAYGLPGVAIAWTLRATVDAAGLMWMAHRHLGLASAPQASGFWILVAMIAAMGAGAFVSDTQMKVWYTVAMFVAFAPFAWLSLLTRTEREGVRAWLRAPGDVGVDVERAE